MHEISKPTIAMAGHHTGNTSLHRWLLHIVRWMLQMLLLLIVGSIWIASIVPDEFENCEFDDDPSI